MSKEYDLGTAHGALYARVQELEKALEPFARMAGSYARCRDSLVIASARGTILSVYDLRTAAALLPKSDQQ